MTKEEAINEYIVPAISRTWNDDRCNEILKALEQEPCTVTEFADRCMECGKILNDMIKPCIDAISRQAAIDTIESWLSCDDYNDAERHIMRAMQSVLYDLLPVTPAEKTGRWVWRKRYWNWVCSECDENPTRGTGHTPNNMNGYKYCPNCGAKMQEV